jgi:serpin B
MGMKPSLWLALLIFAATSACGGKSSTSEAGPAASPPGSPPPDAAAPGVATAEAAAPDAYPIVSGTSRDTSPNVAPADAVTLSTDDLRFAFDLYPGVATDETHNVFYSPYSVSLALAMTYAGAANATAQQIASALHFELPPDKLHPAYDALDLAIVGHATNGVTIDIADSLWGQAGLGFAPAFLDLLGADYGAGLGTVDFAGDSLGALNTINEWVAGVTEQTIPHLLSPANVTPDTVLVLVNALYFHAPWLTQFDPTKTQPASFTRLDGSTVMAPTMIAPGLPCSAARGANYLAVELSYANNATSLVLVVPDPGAFTAVETALSGDWMAGVFGRLVPWDMALSMPKFEIHGPTFSLKDELEKLGMVDAFGDAADFSPMFGAPAAGFALTDVLQQAYVKVDESGSTASAATGVIGGHNSVSDLPTSLAVDRPFLFVVRDVPTNTALFVGRVLDPTQ